MGLVSTVSSVCTLVRGRRKLVRPPGQNEGSHPERGDAPACSGKPAGRGRGSGWSERHRPGGKPWAAQSEGGGTESGSARPASNAVDEVESAYVDGSHCCVVVWVSCCWRMSSSEVRITARKDLRRGGRNTRATGPGGRDLAWSERRSRAGRAE